jgi:4-alpha-glucanotransferase
MKNINATDLFPKSCRASGIVLDAAALPSRYGIGDVGPIALSWVDRLRHARQSWWQVIQTENAPGCEPVYDSFSSFAANELLISPDWLIEDGLLSPGDCECVKFAEGSIDYDVVVPFKQWLLQKAWSRFNKGARKDLRRSYEQFRQKQNHWLEDYALFRALKMKYSGAPYLEWPADLVVRNKSALADARRELASEIDRVRFSQFLVSRQTRRLKEYANRKGVRLIGDLPFLISADSSEAWTYPELFVRDETGANGAALVPFCFSSSDGLGRDDDRAALSRVSYRWCADLLRAVLTQVDAARVDVRALALPRHATSPARAVRQAASLSYYSLALGASRGLIGDGLAMDRAAFGVRDQSYMPETRVLQFAFGGSSDKASIRQTVTPDSVIYAGVPDGVRLRDWFNGLPDDRRSALWASLKRPAGESAEIAWELIRLAWSSTASLAMLSFPDLLNLERDPSSTGDGNYGHRRWRCTEDMMSASAFYCVRKLTRESNRSAERQEKPRPAIIRTSRTLTKIEAAL